MWVRTPVQNPLNKLRESRTGRVQVGVARVMDEGELGGGRDEGAVLTRCLGDGV